MTSANRVLSVNGAINVAPSALPGTPVAGDLAIDSAAANSLKYHNGTSWISLAVGGTGDFLANGSVPMTGQFRSIAGTAAAPGITFVGDTDNGIFAPAADNVAIGTSGSEKLRVLANGYVGIGTSAPTGILHVLGGTAASGTNGTNITITAQAGGSGNADGGSINITGGNSTGSGTAGNVTIKGGTQSISAGAGQVNIYGGDGLSGSPAGDVFIRGGSSPNGKSGDISLISQAGTGAGNNSGNFTFTSGSAGSGANAGSFSFTGGAGGAGGGNGADFIVSAGSAGTLGQGGRIDLTSGNGSTGTAGRIKLQTGSSSSAVFAPILLAPSGGQVGIGITTPSRILHVAGAIRLDPSSVPGSPAAGDIFVDSTSSNALKYHNGSSWVSIGSGTGDFLANGSVAMTGQFRSIAGTAAAPGMTFVGDTDNGIFAPAADNFAIGTSGSEKLRVLANGNVGIGNTNAAYTLDVTGVARATRVVTSTALNLPGTPSHTFTNDSDTGMYIIANDVLGFSTGSAERLRIDGNGYVGIGTSAIRLLDVAGPIRIAPATLPGTPSAGDLAIDSGAANSLKYHNGTSWISLAVGGTGDFLANGSVPMTGQFRSIAGTAAAPGMTFVGDTDNGIFAPAADNIAIGTSGSEKLRVLANGNVGIGTTAPTSQFEVVGTGAFTTSAGGLTTPLLVMNTQASAAADRGAGLRIRASSNIDIGLLGAAWTGAATTDSYLTFQNRTAGTLTEKVRIDNNGYLGVGTSTPNRLLSVNGSMNLTPSALPGTPAAGDIAIDSAAANSLKYHNGTSWISLAVGGTGDFKADGTVPMTGQFRSIAGTAAAPGMTFVGDTDNGIFAPAADNIAIGTSGSEKLRILANGNVGIGTTAPSSLLEVAGPTKITTSLTGSSAAFTATTSGTDITLTSNGFGIDDPTPDFRLEVAGTFGVSNGPTGDGDFFNINSSGQVGVGVTSPSRLLHLAGPMRINPTANPASPTAGDIFVDSTSSNALKYHNGSNWVSIGSGSGDFLANGSVAMTGQFRSIAGTAAAPGMTFNGDTDNGIFAPAADNIAIATSGSEKLRVLANGYVGMGTTSPLAPLHIVSGVPYGSPTLALGGSSYNLISTTTVDASDNQTITINGGGGIGANRGGSVVVEGNESSGNVFVGAGNNLSSINTGKVVLQTNGYDRMTVTKDGNVGIGTTGPNRLLEVAGPIRISPATLPGSPAAGDVAIDSSASNTLKYHNGSSWVSIGSGSGDFLANGSVPMTGQIRAVAGTEAAPGFSFVGDTDNGIFAPAADNIAIGTSGTEKIRVLANGNVGIGYTNPATDEFMLYRDQNGATNATIWNPNTGTSAYTANFLVTGSNNFGFNAYGENHAFYPGLARISAAGAGNTGLNLQTGTAQPLSFGTNSVERMRINSSGFVGVGTTSPSRLIDVAGPIRIAPTTLPGTPGAGDVAIDSSAANTLKYHNGSSWVSIGSGSGDFMANGSVAMTGQFRSIAGTATAPGITFVGDTNNGIFSPVADSIAFSTSGSEKIRIVSDGSVGLGTTAPSATFDVSSEQGSAVGLRSLIRAGRPGGSYVTLGYLGSGGSDIGGALGSNANLALFTGSSERVRIDTSGQVGIGTTAPSRLLQVAGAMKLTPTANPGTPTAGDIFVDSSSSNTLKYHNGSAWVSIGSGSGDFMANGSVPMTGQFQSIAGTAAAPGISFVGDTNNGIFSPAADIVAIGTSGSEKLRVLANGYVGIATTNPVSGLEVADEVRSSGPNAAYVLADPGGSARVFEFGTDGSSSWLKNKTNSGGSLSVRSSSNNEPFSVSYNAPNASLLVGNSGNVGVGVTTPGRLLDVTGGIRIAPTAAPGTPTAGDIFVDSASSNTLKYHNGSAWVSIAGGGGGDFMANGSVPMTGQFQSIAGTLAAPGITFVGETNTGIFKPAAGTLAIGTSGAERIRILPSGFVGIGTNAPAAALDLVGTNFNHTFAFGIASYTLNGTNNSTGQAIVYLNAGTGGTQKSGFMKADLTKMALGTNSTNSSMDLEFQTNSQPRMRIDTTGNVGIGTTSPNAKLDVAGQVRLTASATGPSLYVMGPSSGSSNLLMQSNAGTGTAHWITSASDGVLKIGATGVSEPSSGAINIESGKVGIGTTSPSRLLQVAGAMKITPTAIPSTPTAGDIFVDSSSANLLKYHNGSAWVSLDGGGSGDFLASGTVPMTGQFQAIGGTATAPGISFAGDLNNGIFSPSADILALSTSGTERLRVLANGNIGIGTTSPANALDIAGGGIAMGSLAGIATSPGYIITSGRIGIGISNPNSVLDVGGNITISGGNGLLRGSNNLSVSMFGGSSAANGAAFWAYGSTHGSTASEAFIDSTKLTVRAVNGGAAKMTITSAGDVGIGITSPSAKLDVNGAILSNNYVAAQTSGGNVRASIFTGSGDGGFEALNSSNVKQVSLSSSGVSYLNGGNVGIGTTNPTNPLQVIGASNYGVAEFVGNGTNVESSIGFRSSNITRGSAGNFVMGTNLSNTQPGSFTIYAAPASQAFTIESGGDVGIGTTNPTSKLDVGGTLKAYQFFTGYGSASTPGFGTSGTGMYYDGSGLAFSTSSGERVRIDTTGRVGIGVNPSVALDVNGDIEYTGTITDVSDRRLKENITPLDESLAVIRELPVYSYTMKGDENKRVEYGVMAQDLRSLVPNLTSVVDKENGYIGVNYIGLIPWSIRAIQQVDREVASVKAENQILKSRLDKLEEQNKVLADQVQKLIDLQNQKSQ